MIRRVHSSRGRRQAGFYPIEGIRLAERALRSGAPLEAVLIAERLARSDDTPYRTLLDELNAAGCSITVAPDSVLAELTEGRDLGPILGLVRMPSPITLSDLLSTVSTSDAGAYLPPSSPASLLLAAVDIVDPGNVGALTRTAHAAGADALLAVGASDPFHPRATRISRGSIFKLPIIQYETAAALVLDLRANSIAMIGAVAAGHVPLPKFTWPTQGAAVLMGNEAEGLPLDIQAALDCTVAIPMPAGVDSYSVNAAAAIMLYAAAQSQKREG